MRRPLEVLILVVFAGFLSSCGDNSKTLPLNYTVATGADAAPNFIVLVSLSPDLQTFSQNIAPVVDGSGTHYFYDRADDLKKCAVAGGFIKPEGFITGSTTGSCDNLATLYASMIGSGINLTTQPNPLSTEGTYQLLDSNSGYVFALFFYHADRTTASGGVRCFEICASQIQNKRFLTYNSSTSSLTAEDALNCSLSRVSQSVGVTRCYDY